jgi:Tol biopolymer transport system component
VYHDLGSIEQITSNEGEDISPSWSRDGKEIVFTSDRSGQREIWVKNLDTGELTQITTDGGYSFPSISPDGKKIAWIRIDEGLYVYDRGTGIVNLADAPKQVNFAPAWSTDGRFIAVTGKDWGYADVYLLTADGQNAALLTKTVRGEGEPAWSPDGRAIATVTAQGDILELWILTGIEPYKDRLMTPMKDRQASAQPKE